MGRAAKAQKAIQDAKATVPERIDIGCGKRKAEGFYGVDVLQFPGVDLVLDVRNGLPWPDNSVTQIHTSHFIEHLTGWERAALANEVYRVLKPGCNWTIVVPHWCSNRAYGDPSHMWPPVSEMWFYYLSKDWRQDQAPATDKANDPRGFDCDFHAQWGYNELPRLAVKNEEYKQHARENFKEVLQDIMATLTKKEPT